MPPLPPAPTQPASEWRMQDLPTPKPRRKRQAASPTLDRVEPVQPSPSSTASNPTGLSAEPPAPKLRRPSSKQPAALLAASTPDVPALTSSPALTTPPKARATKRTPKTAATGVQPPAVQSSPHRAPKPAAGPTKLFVLDTNVLLHDPMSLFRFEEHDVYLPMIVLEELDAHKKGMTEVARNGRQTSRLLDALAEAPGSDIALGLPLEAKGHREASGRLFFQTHALESQLPAALPPGKADNQILGVVDALRRQHAPREVVLVSKDINMRVKARALGLPAEDYQNDKVLEDGELLYSGVLALPADFWTAQGQGVESWQQGAHTFYRVSGPLVHPMLVNQFVYAEPAGEPALYARVTELRGKTAVLQTLKDYTHLKNAVWGITTRNREQNFAMNLLMNPDIDFVTLTGTAGTGKTLLALAAGLTQVLDERRYSEIIVTRATVSVGEDIGFLPGTEEEKMGPWMGALDDNLEVLGKTDGHVGGEWGRAAAQDLIRSRVKIKSMNFMRGRTFLNRYVIIDEAQNLTPKQMKTLITRAGPGTKIVCMGNLAQIDTPYLTEGASGLTYAVDRFKGWAHAGHILLARGERSRLADFASDVL